jgi:glycosyltransferase involved in cell wall biosynthesis
MWVGGFYPWHDLDLLIESFSQVLQKQPKARLVVAQKVMRNGLGHAVIMTGAIAHTRVPEMVSIAEVAVVPAAPLPASRGGTGTPLKLFEYMAAGKAIVATSLNQAAEVIQDGHNGVLVEAGDVNGFAKAMLDLLDDTVKRGHLGQNARQHAVEQYSWEQYTRRLEEIYLSVVS